MSLPHWAFHVTTTFFNTTCISGRSSPPSVLSSTIPVMSHPQPPTRQPTLSETEKYGRAVHAACIASVVIAPILALLPPRKIDLYTLSLGVLTTYSANRLYRESHSGRSFWDREPVPPAERAGALLKAKASELPTDRAREFQRQYQARIDAEAKSNGKVMTDEEKERASRTILEKTWYGSESEHDWKAKREKEVQEKLAEGKGYADIITDQIWEVWNWGRDTNTVDDGNAKSTGGK